MKKFEDSGLLVARILISILFIIAGYGKLGPAYAGTQEFMEVMKVPGILLPLTILLELGGGLAILFGLLTRTTAVFTFIFCILTALLFHHDFADGMNQTMFLKNFAIGAGYLMLAMIGPGRFSIDGLLKKNW
ncbi:DoxX family protein [Xenorhabdus nematophila]|uniref:Membrane protein n=1 Tax=Xenorhabdus nematophila (strain ATCC 19061 / DSM 3370 / CCUG 14189 / LMG 1036 / NCIMB 9965 / AN6) TaxID=406817 RepID=D3VDD8_XENNA|nr:DoxX family protein [Xenorhabdus nematophila]CEE90819.1 putative membrane protein [Xenorhabdus nematophila str. Anatoliense]CEF28985.1 putative membrane protein [Xenorhabdus nematophila str. Websteri]AYA42038.1 DoxX family protein [Xenorhabdus nematophila]KHD28251.1 membrane protein [Xenorhabdus nematophila]MBA0020759.1 DoxX family protein [Xenorhabdus nematophila]